MLALCLALSCFAFGDTGDVPAALAWHGTVRASLVEDGVLVEKPLPGAVVVLGRGLRLATGADGRDSLTVEGAGPRAFTVATVDAEGEFFVEPLSGSGPSDLLVWSSGYTPVLRQGVASAQSLDVVLPRAGSSSMHLTLLRPDGLLVLPVAAAGMGLPFVDASAGFLYLPPPEFTPVPLRGALTLARFARGAAEIRVIQMPGSSDPATLDRVLEEQTRPAAAGDARLLRSERVAVDRGWCTLREYRSEAADTCALYMIRGGTTVAVLLSSPHAGYAEALAAFRASLPSIRFLGARPMPIEIPGKAESVQLGVCLGLPVEWQVDENSATALRLVDPDRRWLAQATRARAPAEGLAPLLDAETAGLRVRDTLGESWELVAGCPALVRTVVVSGDGRNRPRVIRALAVWRESDVVVIRLEGPRSGSSQAPAVMDELQGAIRFRQCSSDAG